MRFCWWEEIVRVGAKERQPTEIKSPIYLPTSNDKVQDITCRLSRLIIKADTSYNNVLVGRYLGLGQDNFIPG